MEKGGYTPNFPQRYTGTPRRLPVSGAQARVSNGGGAKGQLLATPKADVTRVPSTAVQFSRFLSENKTFICAGVVCVVIGIAAVVIFKMWQRNEEKLAAEKKKLQEEANRYVQKMTDEMNQQWQQHFAKHTQAVEKRAQAQKPTAPPAASSPVPPPLPITPQVEEVPSVPEDPEEDLEEMMQQMDQLPLPSNEEEENALPEKVEETLEQ